MPTPIAPIVNGTVTHDRLFRHSAGVVMMSMLLAWTPADAAESVTLSSNQLTPAINTTFTVSIQLSNASGFSCWGQAVRWNSSILELIGQSSGTFTTFVPDSRSLADINASGEIRTGGFYETSGTPAIYPDNATASGTLAVLSFKRIAVGTTQVTAPTASTSNRFGLKLITAAGAERTLPTAPAALVLTDPAVVLPSVTIVATDAAATESGTAPGRFTVTRTGSTATALLVSIAWSGTATATTDYAPLSTSLSIPVGQTQATISVTPVNDAVPESDETVIATIQATGSYTVASPSAATVIISDAIPPPGSGSGSAPASGSGGGGCGVGAFSGLMLSCLALMSSPGRWRRRHAQRRLRLQGQE